MSSKPPNVMVSRESTPSRKTKKSATMAYAGGNL